MKYLLVILIPLIVVGVVYIWRDAIDEALPWLKGWRTVVLNAIPAVGVVLTDVLGYLAGFEWSGLIEAKTAALMVLATNVANIVLRVLTTTRVGEK